MSCVIKKHEIQSAVELRKDICHHSAWLKLSSNGEVKVLPDSANLENYLTYENMICGFFSLKYVD